MRYKGFTLIELLVVISIIAILAAISMGVFGGIQKRARDVERKSEISAIAKSFEAGWDASSRTYTNGLAADFPGDVDNVPADPISGKYYCIFTDTSTTAVHADPAHWTTACTGATNGTDQFVQITAGASGTDLKSAWKVCASLEATTDVYCKSSVGR